jgi:hypothetical protein
VPSDRYAHLTPGAVSAALRSFPRRYRAALTFDPLRDPEEIADAPTRDGRTARGVLVGTVVTLTELSRALERVLLSDNVDLPPAVRGGSPATLEIPDRPLSAVLERLEQVCTTMAKLLEDAPANDLLRTGTAAEGKRVSAVDIGRQAVRVAAENLLTIERGVGASDSDR